MITLDISCRYRLKVAEHIKSKRVAATVVFNFNT